ncbi:MAG TPA: shikimate kinase [Bacteroidales bacterium]|nr:shikimate kinase [Bacteroidales bacterium]
MADPKRIYFIGYMGSGKSTAGRKLASMLGWDFIDLDEIIEEKNGRTIEEIFLFSGEGEFRKIESNLLRNIACRNNTVISVGGGAPCFFGNMDFMNRTGRTIYLKMKPEDLSKRIRNDSKTRPLLKGLSGGELQKFIEMKLAEREYYYLQSGLVVDGNNLDLEEIKSRF